MAPGKHDPTRFSTYIRVHENYLDRLVREGFVRPDHDLVFEAVPGGMLLEGTASCLGGITVQVRKLLEFRDEGQDPMVQTRWYSYNVTLQGVGIIFRYDSPFLPDLGGHHRHHHVHHFDVLKGDREGIVGEIEDPEMVPTLGEVIEEARNWYYENLDELRKRGLAH